MEKKTRRKTVSFSFNEDTIRRFEAHCIKKQLNRSRFVENLILDHLNSNTARPKEVAHDVPQTT